MEQKQQIKQAVITFFGSVDEGFEFQRRTLTTYVCAILETERTVELDNDIMRYVRQMRQDGEISYTVASRKLGKYVKA